jgi:hypothetical protein
MPGFRRVSPTHVVDETTGEEFFMPDPGLNPRTDFGEAPELEMPAEFIDGESPVPTNLAPGSETISAWGDPFAGPAPGPGMNGPLPTPRTPEEIQAAVEQATPAPPPDAARTPSAAPSRAAVPQAPQETPGMVPQDPYAPVNINVPRNRQELASMYGEQIAANQQAARSQYSADLAMADAEKKSADELAAATQQFATSQAQQMAYADQMSQMRWEEWQNEYNEAAKAQVDPQRYWNSKDNWGKAAWALALMAGSWNQQKQGGDGRNVPLEMLQSYVNQDIEAQKSNIDARLRGLAAKEKGLARQDQMSQQRLTNLATAQSLKIDGLIKLAEARKAGVSSAQAKAGWDKTIAALQQQKTEVGVTLYEDIRKEEEVKAAQKFQAQEAAKARAFQRSERLAREQADREAAAAKAKADAEKEAAKKKDEGGVERGRRISPRLGIQATNRITGEAVEGGVARDDKDAVKGMASAVNAGNKKYTTITRMLEALDDETATDILRGGAADIKAFYRQLALTSARVDQPGGVLTDQDVNQGGEIVTGHAGPGWWERVKTPGDLRAMLEQSLAGVEQETQAQVNEYADADYDHTYVPQLTYPRTKAKERTVEDALTEAAGPKGRVDRTGQTPLRRPEAGETLDDEDPQARAKYWLEKTGQRLPKMAPEDEAWVQKMTAGFERAKSLEELDRWYNTVWSNTTVAQEPKERVLIEIRFKRAQMAAEQAQKEASRREFVERNTMRR